VKGKVPVGILFKSAHTRGGFGENLRLHDITMKDIPVVMRITMNWNPELQLRHHPGRDQGLPAVLEGAGHAGAAREGHRPLPRRPIWNIKATGATTAFEVDGYREAPLSASACRQLDIEAKKGGHIYDASDWTVRERETAPGRPGRVEDAAPACSACRPAASSSSRAPPKRRKTHPRRALKNRIKRDEKKPIVDRSLSWLAAALGLDRQRHRTRSRTTRCRRPAHAGHCRQGHQPLTSATLPPTAAPTPPTCRPR
jgi:hypothetical protein